MVYQRSRLLFSLYPRFLKLVLSNNFCSKADKPIRIKCHVGRTSQFSDHDIVSGTLKIFIPPIRKPRRKVYRYQKGDYESMRKDTLEFAKEKYFSGCSDARSVQENFHLLTSFIQDSADKHIPSKTNRSVSSFPWITPEIRRKIRRKNKTHAKAKKTESSKLRSKFET